VSLKVYNVAGQLVRTLVDEMQTPVESGFAKEWNGQNAQGQPVSSGVYFYKLVTKGFTQTKKMVLLK
jgi:flagellar hook assembly protein FlgD